MRSLTRLLLPALLTLIPTSAALAQIAISVNDNKVMLVNGAVQVVQNPVPDTMTVIDLRSSPPRAVSEIPVPASVVGPPFSVAITPDEGLALVTSNQKVDPADRTKTINDNHLSAVDLTSNRPACPSTARARSRWWPTAGTAASPSTASRARR
jgi:hypothetical protein